MLYSIWMHIVKILLPRGTWIANTNILVLSYSSCRKLWFLNYKNEITVHTFFAHYDSNCKLQLENPFLIYSTISLKRRSIKNVPIFLHVRCIKFDTFYDFSVSSSPIWQSVSVTCGRCVCVSPVLRFPSLIKLTTML
jgi:hypothetical protein